MIEQNRAILVDYLADLHFKFKLRQETLYVTVGIIDQYLSRTPDFSRTQLQVLGVTALHIAGKYEEIYPPELKNILRVTDSNITKEQVIELEFNILLTLQFGVTFPSAYRFLERFCRLAQATERHFKLAQYITDSSLLDCALVRERPSRVAACSLYIALNLLQSEEASQSYKQTGSVWSHTLVSKTGYRLSDIHDMSRDILQYVKNIENSRCRNFYRKFRDPRFDGVALLIEHFQF